MEVRITERLSIEAAIGFDRCAAWQFSLIQKFSVKTPTSR